MNRNSLFTYSVSGQCTRALAVNSNNPFTNFKTDPLEGVDEITIGFATVITNCKGTLLNGTVDEESIKSSICRATA